MVTRHGQQHSVAGWITGLLLAWCLTGSGIAMAQDESSLPAEDNAPTFKLNVIQSHYLPPAMYGTWSITTTVLRSTAPPGSYMPLGSEIWSLGQEQGDVILKNLATHAVTSVHVDQISGNTATFHHTADSPSQNLKILETPTITVTGNTLTGINRQEVTFYRNKKPVATYVLEIQVEGSRLAGAQVLFENPAGEHSPQFEVAPLHFKD